MKNFIYCIIVCVLFSCSEPTAPIQTDTTENSGSIDTGVEVKLDNITVSSGIKPNNITPNQIETDVNNYYTYYKETYIKESNGNTPGGGYYIEANSTGSLPGSWGDVAAKSNSEAHGYGMIISALMEDKEIFDGMFNMFTNYKSTINPALMSWIIPETEDPDLPKAASATDGDMDIGYALLIAHDKWGSEGVIDYLNESKKIIRACEESLIGDNNVILMGDWCKTSGVKYSTSTRSSDWFPGHYELFQQTTQNSVWTDVLNTIYTNILPNVAHSVTGFVPDFVKGDYSVPDGYFLESEHDGSYNWNACRYPWRQTVGYNHISDNLIKKNIKFHMINIADFIITKIGSDNNFNNIKAGYRLNGDTIPGRSYSSGAFTSPIVSSFIVDEKYQEQLNDGWEHIKSLKETYFADSITMLSMLNISGVWYSL